ncbi:MAG TPA: 6,7-dimethyl-8-ribityllumazine synthase [Alphaproteobacteria bacterium]
MTNQTNLNGKKIGFIKAGWHADIIEQGLNSFVADLEKAGIAKNSIEVIDVAGSLEIPLQAKKMAETGQYAIIACGGFIINGGIYHHEYVNHAVIDGMMRVGLDTGVPILSMVLTPLNFHQSEQHHKFFFDHFVIKGKELAAACLKTLENMQVFEQPTRKAA